LVDELLTRLRSSPSGFGSSWVLSLSVAVTELDRAHELGPLFEIATLSTPWLDAGRAYAAGAFREAADILGAVGAAGEEAFVRLRAAESLIEADRRAEADAQLQRALAFYRSMGATAYIREAEALFAASA
jgi:hypothetical protein